MNDAQTSSKSAFQRFPGGGRAHQGAALALGLVMTAALLGCSEEIVVYEPSVSAGDGGDGADTSGPQPPDARDAGADAKAPVADSSVAQPDTSVVDTSASQLCVDTINAYRKTLNLPPYQRWTSDESCAGTQGLADSKSGTPHSAFGKCGEWAQNECPGWPGPDGQMITGCLQMMWNEGPGSDFSKHGHYINMSSTQYTKVACGFATAADGSVWAVQDFQ